MILAGQAIVRVPAVRRAKPSGRLLSIALAEIAVPNFCTDGGVAAHVLGMPRYFFNAYNAFGLALDEEGKTPTFTTLELSPLTPPDPSSALMSGKVRSI